MPIVEYIPEEERYLMREVAQKCMTKTTLTAGFWLVALSLGY